MPDRSSARLSLVADLTIEVGDERGATTATLTRQDSGDLVLDVGDPLTMLRCLPSATGLSDVTTAQRLAAARRFASDHVADPLVLSQQGRVLGRVTSTANGFRVRPTLAAAPLVARGATQYLREHGVSGLPDGVSMSARRGAVVVLGLALAYLLGRRAGRPHA